MCARAHAPRRTTHRSARPCSTSTCAGRLPAARSRRRCGRGEPSPGADVAGASPVPAQMWQGRAQSRRRCGRGERSPGADVAGASAVPAQVWQGRAQSRRRCGRGAPCSIARRIVPDSEARSQGTFFSAPPPHGARPSRIGNGSSLASSPGSSAPHVAHRSPASARVVRCTPHVACAATRSTSAARRLGAPTT
jgi:hypothetical protein